MNTRVASTKTISILLVTMIGLSAFALVYVPARYHPIHFADAETLSQQPDTYFVLENPDAVVSQAIEDGHVTVYSLEDTQIDELISAHETSNIKVNESYYSISIAFGDKFPPIWVAYLYLISLVILPLSIIALIALILLKAKNWTRRNIPSDKI